MFKLISCKRLWRYQSKRFSNYLGALPDPVLRDVMTRGYAIIPNYWHKNRCEEARQVIDQCLLKPEIKIWADPLNADLRLMGADRLSNKLDMISDPKINHMIERLYGKQNLAKFTMASKLTAKQGNLGSGQGWHRDSAFVYQFKAILYLNDVGKNQGPFQYCEKSGGAFSMLNLEHQFGFSLDKNRFSANDIQQIKQNKIRELCAEQGTLLIVNTRGIHRGKPILSGERYALTNYYWSDKIPEHIDKFVN